MRRLNSLQWRMSLAYTALMFITMGAVTLYLVSFIRGTYFNNLEERLAHEAGLLAGSVEPLFSAAPNVPEIRALSVRMGQLIAARITVIALDGTVLADTWEDPATMENHAGRPEVQGALAKGLGTSTRQSAADGQELLYVAAPVRVGGAPVGIARVAEPTTRVQAQINRIIATVVLAAIVVGGLSVALGLILARRISRSIRSITEGARRLGAGDLEHRVHALAPDETQDLADAFNRMAAALRDVVHNLSGERNKLSSVLDTMADAVVVIGPETNVALLNKAAEALLDVRAGATVGVRFAQAVRDSDLQRLVHACLETKQQQRGEVELLRPRRTVSAIATPLPEGAATSVLLTLHDLTAVRQVETTRKEFVSNVSHELRTPLASVKAMVETLEGGALHDPTVATDFLQRINREVDRMTGMVSDLLELSRLESVQATFHPTRVPLRPIVDEVVGQLRSRAEAKRVSLSAALPDGMPDVLGESEKLRQVLVNLLDNAVKFTPSGGKVAVSAWVDQHAVELRVTDTGIGIPAEHLPHVFERFYKVDRARRDGGHGLGLSIVKHIVQLHGGQVRVESREGAGSTFAFSVPRAT